MLHPASGQMLLQILGEPGVIENDACRGAVRDQFKLRDRINSGRPVSGTPRLHDPFIRDKFDVAAFNLSVEQLEQSADDVRNSSQSREKAAMAISALCIGGVVLSRSINDRALGEKLRAAATDAALELGGWTAKRRKRSA